MNPGKGARADRLRMLRHMRTVWNAVNAVRRARAPRPTLLTADCPPRRSNQPDRLGKGYLHLAVPVCSVRSF